MSSDSCVVVVGTTGTGKTSTINIYTGNKLEVGSDSDSITRKVESVKDKNHKGNPKWIDTPGWGDSKELSDNETFKDILRFMQNDEKCSMLKAVVWCVRPTMKKDANLQAQAELISMFTPNSGDIWNNVVIVVIKGNDEIDVQGAIQASHKKCDHPHSDPLATMYTFATDEDVENITEKFRKEKKRILMEDEIRKEIEALFCKLPAPIKVVFANQRCLACGQVGDYRTMTDTCHKEKSKEHTGKLKHRFSKASIGAAWVLGAVGAVGVAVGALVAGVEALVTFGVIFLIPGLGCTSHRTAEDCNCGPNMKILEKKHTCCKNPESVKECTGPERCVCGEEWGTAKDEKNPGCVVIKAQDRRGQEIMGVKYKLDMSVTHDLKEVDPTELESLIK